MRFIGQIHFRILRGLLVGSACCLIAINTTAFATGMQTTPKNDAARDQWVATLFTRKCTVTFKQVPIVQALATISQKTGVPIQILLQDQPAGSPGIDPETAIDLECKNATALSIVELVLRQVSDATQSEYRWQTTTSGIEIGPKSRLLRASALERRAYSVTDVGFKAPDFQAPPLQSGGGSGGGSGGTSSPPFTSAHNDARYQKLKSLIEATVESDVWSTSSSGACTISVFDDKLIVIAPDFVHRAIAQRRLTQTITQPTGKPTH